MKIERATPWKATKTSKIHVFRGTCFLMIFWTTKKLLFGLKIGPNHSPAQAQNCKKIDKKSTLVPHWCFSVFEAASGHVFRWFRARFGMDFAWFSERFRGTCLAKELAIDRLPQPQKSFSDDIFGTPWAQNLQWIAHPTRSIPSRRAAVSRSVLNDNNNNDDSNVV